MADEVEQLTLEQLHGLTTDPETEKKVAQALELPEGTYNSTPELMLTIREGSADSQNPGRKSARFYGFFVGKGVKVEGEGPASERELAVPQPQGRAGFAMSWEYRDKVDFQTKEVVEGKPDLQSRLWHQACQVYRQVHGLARGEQLNVPDVLTYLQKYSVAVRFMKGDDSNIALSISRAKE